MNMTVPKPSLRRRTILGFSMVEMIACVSIIGVIAFLAIPSITRMRSDSERNLAIARAESMNLAMATYIQVVGRTQAGLNWTAATTTAAKYDLLRPYLAYSEATITTYMPQDYTLTFPTTITSMTKAALTGPSGVIPY
jgi:prepilin-type N-terminal cleavage/methylation domain-containing protein